MRVQICWKILAEHQGKSNSGQNSVNPECQLYGGIIRFFNDTNTFCLITNHSHIKIYTNKQKIAALTDFTVHLFALSFLIFCTNF